MINLYSLLYIASGFSYFLIFEVRSLIATNERRRKSGIANEHMHMFSQSAVIYEKWI
jgi:hypothetical protein